ncbi:MAG: F0F1 ATP synthase subunit epsilon [Actinomycetaceae bacterium]|nr:F0F1 ATP synthase subunit epsilon [Actinomycetaceae bacterium]
MPLHVEVVDRQGEIWSGEATHVAVPSIEGDLGVLPGRQPVLLVMKQGVVRIDPVDGSGTVSVQVDQGFVSVDADTVTVVVERDFAGDSS